MNVLLEVDLRHYKGPLKEIPFLLLLPARWEIPPNVFSGENVLLGGKLTNFSETFPIVFSDVWV